MHEPMISTAEARDIRERAGGKPSGSTTYLPALLATEGSTEAQPLPRIAWRELAEQVRLAMSGTVARSADGEMRAVAVLAAADAVLELLDDGDLGALVGSALPGDVILSRADGVVAGAPAWRRCFQRPLRDLPPRALRPGISAWIALCEGARMEVLRCSQHLPPGSEPAAGSLPCSSRAVPPAHVVLLDGGVLHRPGPEGSVWLSLELVRAWIKPEVLVAAALSPERLARLGEQGRRWSGTRIGLPTSVEEFLAIEEAALASGIGLATGSGI